MADITSWEATEIKTIVLTQDVGKAQYSLNVRRFVPEAGDAISRMWKNRAGGEMKSHKCATYAIADIASAVREILNFVDVHMNAFLEHYIADADPLVSVTFRMAMKYGKISKVCL